VLVNIELKLLNIQTQRQSFLVS